MQNRRPARRPINPRPRAHLSLASPARRRCGRGCAGSARAGWQEVAETGACGRGRPPPPADRVTRARISMRGIVRAGLYSRGGQFREAASCPRSRAGRRQTALRGRAAAACLLSAARGPSWPFYRREGCGVGCVDAHSKVEFMPRGVRLRKQFRARRAGSLSRCGRGK